MNCDLAPIFFCNGFFDSRRRSLFLGLVFLFFDPSTQLSAWAHPIENLDRQVRYPLLEVCDAPVVGIAEAPDGKLWFATWGEGMFWYDGVKKGNKGLKDGLETPFFRDCQFDCQGTLWVSSNNGVYVFHEEGPVNMTSHLESVPQEFFGIEPDRSGRVFVGGSGGFAFSDSTGNLQFHRLESELLASQNNRSLLVDEGRGVLWTGWENGLLIPLDLETWKPRSDISMENFIGYGSINDLALDAEGNVWVAAADDTLVLEENAWTTVRPEDFKGRWDCQSLSIAEGEPVLMALAAGIGIVSEGRLTFVDHNTQFSEDHIHKVFHSSTGDIWFGSEGGVTCLLESFFQKEEIPIDASRLMDIDLDREGRLWVGGDGLCYREKGVWHRVDVGALPEGAYLSRIDVGPSGRILSSWNYAGVYIWENGQGSWLPDPPNRKQRFNSVAEDLKGRVWVGTTTDGVIGWNGHEWIRLPGQDVNDVKVFHEGGLGGRSVHSLLVSKDGSLWIGSVGSKSSLFRFVDGKTEVVKGPVDMTYAEIEEMVELEDGTLVMATNGSGILEYKDGNWVIHNRKNRDFLTDRFISLEQSKEGAIWAGTRADGLYHYSNQIWTHFSRGDGFLKCRVDGLALDENDHLFLATHLEEGPLSLIPDPDPPETFITDIPQRVLKGENFVLAVGGSDPWMKTEPKRIRFRWSLDGEAWRSAEKGQTVSVRVNNAGTHEIRVAAVDIFGNVDPTPATAQFQASYHWANHPVTMIGFFVLLVNLLWLGFYFSTRYKYLKETHQRDLIHQKELEEEVDRQTRDLRASNDFKKTLITNVSHDFRTPLTNLIGYATLLGSENLGTLSQSQKEFLHVIQNNAERMKRLIENVSQVMQNEKAFDGFPKGRVDLKEQAFAALVSHALSAVDQKIDLELICEDRDFYIEGSDVLIGRMLDNLLSNAIKFSEPGGKIEIRLEGESEWIRLLVVDEGIGIDSEDLPRIFDRFSQFHPTKKGYAGGLGIGLSICKEIADYHKAHIEVNSKAGEGSTFIVTWKETSSNQDPLPTASSL